MYPMSNSWVDTNQCWLRKFYKKMCATTSHIKHSRVAAVFDSVLGTAHRKRRRSGRKLVNGATIEKALRDLNDGMYSDNVRFMAHYIDGTLDKRSLTVDGLMDALADFSPNEVETALSDQMTAENHRSRKRT